MSYKLYTFVLYFLYLHLFSTVEHDHHHHHHYYTEPKAHPTDQVQSTTNSADNKALVIQSLWHTEPVVVTPVGVCVLPALGLRSHKRSPRWEHRLCHRRTPTGCQQWQCQWHSLRRPECMTKGACETAHMTHSAYDTHNLRHQDPVSQRARDTKSITERAAYGTPTTMIMIIMITIIALRGRFLQSPHCAANCLQHVRSSGQGAIICKSRSTHRELIACNLSCVWQSLNRTYFSFILLNETINRRRNPQNTERVSHRVCREAETRTMYRKMTNCPFVFCYYIHVISRKQHEDLSKNAWT